MKVHVECAWNSLLRAVPPYLYMLRRTDTESGYHTEAALPILVQLPQIPEASFLSACA
jgi:hypothetical protein